MKISESLSENFQFLMVNFSVYLNRRVFVMRSSPFAHLLRFIHYNIHFAKYYQVFLFQIANSDYSSFRHLSNNSVM